MYYLLKIIPKKINKHYTVVDKYDSKSWSDNYIMGETKGLFISGNDVLTVLNQKFNVGDIVHDLYEVDFEWLAFPRIDVSDYILDDLADILNEVLPLWDKRDEPIIILMGLDEETACETCVTVNHYVVNIVTDFKGLVN